MFWKVTILLEKRRESCKYFNRKGIILWNSTWKPANGLNDLRKSFPWLCQKIIRKVTCSFFRAGTFSVRTIIIVNSLSSTSDSVLEGQMIHQACANFTFKHIFDGIFSWQSIDKLIPMVVLLWFTVLLMLTMITTFVIECLSGSCFLPISY